MKLLRFRVTNFRSVDDSGWIDVQDITAFIGTNEAGKTNLLIPLWKFRPATGGEIDPIADYPRKRYNEIRNLKKKPVFIETLFELSDSVAMEIAELTNQPFEKVKKASITRNSRSSVIYPLKKD